MASLPGCWLSLLAAYKGDENDLATRVEETQRALANHPMAIAQEALTWARAVGDACRGDNARALRRIAAVNSPGVALMAALDRIEIAVQAGRRAKALGWIVELETFATVTGAAWAAAQAAHCRALLSLPDAADEMFRAALDHHARSRRPFERARTELSYGEYLRRARRRVDARLHLRAALDTFEDLRAAPWRKRALQELRASGERARQRDQHAHPQLTAQELQVARFVAQGLSNRDVAAQLFVSPRTIDFHLRNVFTKVGVSSRTQLAHASLE
jgi:DNA-binding CsgD family transcriptional regulator